MPEKPNKPPPPEGVTEFDQSKADFPSDALSVKRLRKLFSRDFEQGMLTDGYGHFFAPIACDKPAHLVELNDLLSAERVLANYAFYEALDPENSLDEECHWCADRACERMERLYQRFKLADSPETARLLIRHVEEQGRQQGLDVARGRSR